MKKHTKQLFSSLPLLLVLAVPLRTLAGQANTTSGDGDDIKKTKNINKSYNVSADNKLKIENSFGNVVVSTWDKPQITVDIEIVAHASTEDKAQALMDKLDVKDSQEGKTIAFKSNVDNVKDDKNWKHKGDGDEDRRFYIDYIIHMPAANPLSIENSFGKTEVPDFKGLVSLTSKFGSLNAGSLANVDAIDVEFGKARIGEVTNGKVVFKFDDEARIGKVNGNVKINTEFSGHVQFNVADEIKELSVFESYSGVRVVVTKNLSAQFDIHTSFGNFHNDTDFSIKQDKDDDDNYGPHFDKDYAGTAGGGKARIKIKSSFGNVRLSHTNDESKIKEGKNKHKDKDDGDDDDDADDSGNHNRNHNRSRHTTSI
jgi:hypothetical protein